MPFILMESTPSNTNWQQTPQLKKPGQHRQEMLLAIGHGADTTMYFQWRKSLGAAEKMHGAVVDHGEAERTRVFQDIAAHGAFLKHLDGVVGTTVRPEVGLVHDWEVRWAIMYTQGPRQSASARALRPGVPPDLPGPLPPVLEAGHPGRHHREPVGVRSLQGDRRAHVVHAEARRRGSARRVRQEAAAPSSSRTSPASSTRRNWCSAAAGPAAGLRKMAGIWSEEIDSLYPDAAAADRARRRATRSG